MDMIENPVYKHWEYAVIPHWTLACFKLIEQGSIALHSSFYLQLGLTWWSLDQESSAYPSELTWDALVRLSLNWLLFMHHFTFWSFSLKYSKWNGRSFSNLIMLYDLYYGLFHSVLSAWHSCWKSWGICTADCKAGLVLSCWTPNAKFIVSNHH